MTAPRTQPRRTAIIGSGNIGTDLMHKLRRSALLDVAVMVGIDPASDGLARASALDVAVTAAGVDGLVERSDFDDIDVIFDATSAAAHRMNYARLEPTGRLVIDLTPAALGPFVVPAVNLAGLAGERNLNMVTCGGQATIPIVGALSATAHVHYAEIVASISSRSAGPGTRASIDEFTNTTARAIETVGGADRGKAIIVLNPADPPMIMRDTVSALISATDESVITGAVVARVAEVAQYVPGYRLRQQVMISSVPQQDPRRRLVGDVGQDADLAQVTVFLEVEGAGDYLPAYAGNLDIMTAAAVRVAEAAQ
ncbi:Acetaldehyde dehydrogenase [Mycolicibacterium vanbaalenii]|uniref:Acetaldehyde dehydrogenase n=1 Tax=Mycolicibacterium vanbaalenii TaxID=110539 RepID=A0A5S9QI63_MYCVN|nr:acetaldehyde dehydrogenase (acetylating) [Mycolicibacterium vanbaalenii]CAA0117586.1 Acetaldehyde dehydrogenase [Mycolicibacterium vanbaalenii]